MCHTKRHSSRQPADSANADSFPVQPLRETTLDLTNDHERDSGDDAMLGNASDTIADEAFEGVTLNSPIILSSSSSNDDYEDDSSDTSSSISIESYNSSPTPSGSGSSPSQTTGSVPSDYPLPRASDWNFEPLDYVPFRNPSNPPRYVPPEERELGEKFEREEERREEARRERVKVDRILHDDGWKRKWEEVAWTRGEGEEKEKGKAMGKGKGKAKEKAHDQETIHSVSFFPYPQLEGLEWLKNVFVTVGGGNIDFYRCPETSTSSDSSKPRHLKRVETLSSTDPSDPNREEYLTCAWSLNTTTWPFTPMLAVAGVARVIEVYLVGRKGVVEREREEGKGEEEDIVVYLDRTITGHGGTIYQLKFHPLRPHLLLSCSEDRTIRLWDPTLPWGSNREVEKVVREEMKTRRRSNVGKRKPGWNKWTRMRPRVDGELLAILTGHAKPVFTADFHSIYPLVVSGGADGRIKLYQLPESLFSRTPPFPTPPHLNTHPSSPPSRSPSLPPAQIPIIEPFFSTIHLHPGQWPTQVSFLDTSLRSETAEFKILRVAPLGWEGAGNEPRTSIKIWTIDCLGILPNGSYDRHLEEYDLSRSKAMRNKGGTPDLAEEEEGVPWKKGENVEGTISVQPRMPENEKDSLGFRIEMEMVLEGMNCCVGDEVGVMRNGAFRFSEREGEGEGYQAGKTSDDPFLIVPTTTRLPLPENTKDGEGDRQDTPGLYFFRPFPRLPSNPITAPSTTPSFSRTIKGSSTETPLLTDSRKKEKDPKSRQAPERVSQLFPDDRDRSLHDYHPRLQPSLIIDFPTSREDRPETSGMEEGKEAPEAGRKIVHFRSIAMSPDGGEWIVGVGDGGLSGVWKETGRELDSEVDRMEM